MSNKTRKKQLKQIENQTQQGRSMVEMLGVLAIIGVLSIGGIAGYKMAMDRYQANQIANEINLMRTDAKIKVVRGVELLLGSPYDDEKHLNFNANYGVEVAYPVTISDEEGGEEGYSFTLSGIPAGVCKPLATLLDGMDDTAVLEINGKDYETAETPCDNEENEVLVAFSTKDLGVSGGGNSDPEVTDPEQADDPTTCDPSDPSTCEGECTESGCEPCSGDTPYWNGNLCVGCEGGTWDNETKKCICTGSGQTWNMATGECVCSSENQHWDGSGCIACESNEVWNEVDGQCEVPESYCRTNADCNKEGKKGYFCLTKSGKSCEIEFDEDTHKKGTCKLVSSYLKKKAKIGGTTYYSTTSNMTWWSACRFCAARAGGNESGCASGTTGTTAEPEFMAGYEMLQCADKIDVDNKKSGYCHEREAENTSRADDNISERIKDLREMYGCDRESTSCYRYPWLRDSYSSCGAYSVNLTYGDVGYINRNYPGSTYALCE